MAENKTKVSVDPALEAFLDSCLWEKGIREVPKELHVQMTQDLAVRLETWLLQAMFKKLEEKDVQPLEVLVDKGATQTEIMEFLRARVPDFQAVVAEEMEKFKKVYVGA